MIVKLNPDTYIATAESPVITKCFIGTLFETDDGEFLAVSMRDSGFEVHYYGKDFDAGHFSFNNGVARGRFLENNSGGVTITVDVSENDAKKLATLLNMFGYVHDYEERTVES